MKFTTFKKVKGENRLTLKHVTPDAIISGMKANTQEQHRQGVQRNIPRARQT